MAMRPVLRPPLSSSGSLAAFLVTLLLALLAGSSVATAQTVTATVDRTEVTVEEGILLTVTVRDIQRPPEPELPDLSPFTVQAVGQSTQVEFRNGVSTASIEFRYQLLPRQPGRFVIGPAVVEVDGRRHESRPFTVTVLPPGKASSEEQADLFVTATVSDERPYLGQQILYTWRIWQRTQITQASFVEAFEFPGFLIEDLGEGTQRFDAVRNGRQYVVQEIRKALFPQQEGSFTVSGPGLRVQAMSRQRGAGRSILDEMFGRFATEERILRPAPVTVTVRPLPPTPRGFSGLVGRFDISASVSRSQLAAGESTTFEVIISGTGNVQMIPEPKLGDLPGFKAYDEPPHSVLDRSGSALTGSRSFSRALVPLTPGEHTLPSISLTFFDPEAEVYRTASTAPLILAVRPREGTEELGLTETLGPTTGKVAVRILADDILPLHRGLEAVASQRLRGGRWAGWLAGLLLPPAVWVGLFLFQRRRQRYSADRGLARREKALRRARGGIRKVAAGGDEAPETLRLASRTLREYVGDKLGLEGSALTPAEVAVHLREAGVDGTEADRLHAFLDRLEEARYGPTAGTRTTGRDVVARDRAARDRAARDRAGGGLAGELRAHIDNLEREIRRATKR